MLVAQVLAPCWIQRYPFDKMIQWCLGSASFFLIVDDILGLKLRHYTTTLYTVRACVLSHIWLCDRMDCSPPGSSVHGILQARILEWVAVSSSRGSSQPRAWSSISCVSCIRRQILFTTEPPEKPILYRTVKYTKHNHSQRTHTRDNVRQISALT